MEKGELVSAIEKVGGCSVKDTEVTNKVVDFLEESGEDGPHPDPPGAALIVLMKVDLSRCFRPNEDNSLGISSGLMTPSHWVLGFQLLENFICFWGQSLSCKNPCCSRAA